MNNYTLLASNEVFFAASIIIFVILIFGYILVFFSRYKRCPSDKIMVIYGKVGNDQNGNPRSSVCMHGGAAFIWPIIQSYAFLDLTPISIKIEVKAETKDNKDISIDSRFTVGITTDKEYMTNAAERLLGLSMEKVSELAEDIIYRQLCIVISELCSEEISNDRKRFLDNLSNAVISELSKVGLRLINLNIFDLSLED